MTEKPEFLLSSDLLCDCGCKWSMFEPIPEKVYCPVCGKLDTVIENDQNE